MDVRQRTEEIEHMTFAPWATFSDQSRGRMLPEEQDPIRPVSSVTVTGCCTARRSDGSNKRRRCSSRRRETCTAPD